METHKTLLDRVTVGLPPLSFSFPGVYLTELVFLSQKQRYFWGFRAETERWWEEVVALRRFDEEESLALESELLFALLRWAARSSFRLLVAPSEQLWRIGGVEVGVLFAEASRSLGLPLGMSYYLCSSVHCAEALMQQGLRALVEGSQWFPGYGAWVRSPGDMEALLASSTLEGVEVLWEIGGYEQEFEAWPLVDRGAGVLLPGERRVSLRFGKG